MSKINIFYIVVAASLIFTLGILLFPEHNGVTLGIFYDRMTNTPYYFHDLHGKGYPFVFYTPSGEDYGSNFITESFLANFISVFLVVWCGWRFFQRFFKKLTT